MSDIIHLLPESVINQIAAGEVIQRPSSVVKELLENAVDAGADHIILAVKDAGKTLIQVIDNGKGMSHNDVQTAFERHATSKISSADDLFRLRTLGFRGEALSSIASVAQVEVRTRRKGDELGTSLSINGSGIEEIEPISTPEGSNIMVKSLFYNVPARRKFLKSSAQEFNHIQTELERVAMVYPNIAFTLTHNDVEILHLPVVTSLRQRITHLLGKNINQHLLPVESHTEVVRITGFVGSPEYSRKKGAHQYFFVNGRYMRHPYFNKAVLNAYQQLIPEGEYPSYFLWLEVPEDTIDVNVHPTKTEIKFSDETVIFQILSAVIKESLGKFNAVPSIDFDKDSAPDIPVFDISRKVNYPQPSFDPAYNPFHTEGHTKEYKRPSTDWEYLYKGFDNEKKESSDEIFSLKVQEQELTLQHSDPTTEQISFYTLHDKYLFTSVQSGMMIIHIRRAHIRVLFEEYLQCFTQQKYPSQQTLFPELLELTYKEAEYFKTIFSAVEQLGFDLHMIAPNSWSVNGIPSGLEGRPIVPLLQEMIHDAMESGATITHKIQNMLALSLAKSAAVTWGSKMSEEETRHLIKRLFSCKEPRYTPDGNMVAYILADEDLSKKFL